MILPNLAPAVVRCRVSGDLPQPDVRPSAEYFQSCAGYCANGNPVCGEAEAKTLQEAKQGAYVDIASKCEQQGSSVSGTPVYSPNPCPT